MAEISSIETAPLLDRHDLAPRSPRPGTALRPETALLTTLRAGIVHVITLLG
jgi:hypothetical protein